MPGYDKLREVLLEGSHPEYDETLTVVGGFYDPDGFEANRTNRALGAAPPLAMCRIVRLGGIVTGHGGAMASGERPVQNLSPDLAAHDRYAARLRTAFALHESGVALKRAQLRRQHANESDEELAGRLAAWLRERPGAIHGDSAGVLGRRPGLSR